MHGKKLLISGITALLLGTAMAAVAEKPGDDWISMEEVINIMKKQGYTQFSELEVDDGHWEGEGLKNGQEYEFHVDPHSGEVTKDEPDD